MFNNAPTGAILASRAEGVVAQFKGPDDSVIQEKVFGVALTQLDAGKVDGEGAWIVRTPHLPFKANGSGDVTAALFSAHYRETGSAAVALERTASSVFDLIELTYRSGERELQLIEAQEFYAHPRLQFSATRVR